MNFTKLNNLQAQGRSPKQAPANADRALSDSLEGTSVPCGALPEVVATPSTFWDIAPDEARAFWVNDIYSDNCETEKE